MQIGEIARLSGVSKDTVRLYTRMGLIRCTLKNAGSKQYTVYDAETFELIKGIKIMQSLGFTLTEIKPLADAYHSGSLTTITGQKTLENKLKEIEAKQQQLSSLAKQIQHKLAASHSKLKPN